MFDLGDARLIQRLSTEICCIDTSIGPVGRGANKQASIHPIIIHFTIPTQ